MSGDDTVTYMYDGVESSLTDDSSSELVEELMKSQPLLDEYLSIPQV